MPDDTLKDRTILVVEDEYMIAMDLKKSLVRAGAVVVGPAPSLEKALALIKGAPRIDGAILDINLLGEMVFPAADLLVSRGVPFLLATGYDASAIPRRFEAVQRCEKPISADKVCRNLATIVERSLRA